MVRLLFVQSLRRLEHFASAVHEIMVKPAYMILDMEDSLWGAWPLSTKVDDAVRQIKNGAYFIAYADAHEQLAHLVENTT